MLKRLKVDNLAIVEHAAAEFGEGLTVITGETGAGKSVFMGALTLALGARADASAVRDGCREARIEAEFDAAGVSGFLEEQGLPQCEGDELLVRRVISASGGSRVWINDSATSVQTLRALGDMLVDIHGPNDRRSLVDEDFQRDTLDRYGRVDLSRYAAAWGRLCDLKARRAELAGTADVAEEIERLRLSIAEIDAAQITVDDGDALEARHTAAAHAAEIVEAANAAATALSGGDSSYGEESRSSAMDMLISAGGSIREMSKYHDEAAEWMDEVDRLVTSVQELSRAVADSVSRIDADPETLQALDDRISLVRRLERKYSCRSAEELLALRERRSLKLADLEDRDAKMQELDIQIAAAETDVMKAGQDLSAERSNAGRKLGSAVTKELHGLGFLKAGFSVSIEPREPDSTGCDRTVYTFEPNPGEPARPLAQIASTGEIARVMLAVKSAIAGIDRIPTLIFDEIDANLGGEAGRAVGSKLKAVSRHHQVVAITHLPQSAVCGDRHYVVSKKVSGGRTRSAIFEVSGEDRAREIARMLGGKSSSVALSHARELLESAPR